MNSRIFLVLFVLGSGSFMQAVDRVCEIAALKERIKCLKEIIVVADRAHDQMFREGFVMGQDQKADDKESFLAGGADGSTGLPALYTRLYGLVADLRRLEGQTK